MSSDEMSSVSVKCSNKFDAESEDHNNMIIRIMSIINEERLLVKKCLERNSL